VCRHSRFTLVHWLIVVIYCPPFGSDSVWSMGLGQFQIIPRVVVRLGSEVRVSVNFQSFALRMFVCPIMFFAVPSAVPCATKVIFLSRTSCHVLGIPHNGAVVRRCVFSTLQTMGPGRGSSPPRPILNVPNLIAHPSTVSVAISVLLYNGPLLCGINVPLKG